MKRIHIHTSTADLASAVEYYSALFSATPTIEKHDYAKWLLDDPRVNFSVSNRSSKVGVSHLGVQVESAAELQGLSDNLRGTAHEVRDEAGAHCCYAQSDKHWTQDPDGVIWELFHTKDSTDSYGIDAIDDVTVQSTTETQTPARSCC